MKHPPPEAPASGRRLALALSAGFCLFASAALAQEGLELSPEHRKWLDEEVVYIISDREKEAFEELRSAGEREAFIAAFWSRRDPQPLTPENEYRIEHYERMEYANTRLARDDPTPGWMTDRGRIWIQLGEPDERETFTSMPGMYPAELWFYLARDEMLLPAALHPLLQGTQRRPVHPVQPPHPSSRRAAAAQPFEMGNSREEAFITLQEMSPQLAHAAYSMRADRGVTFSIAVSDVATLDTQRLLQDINRAPYRTLDTAWVAGASAGRGLVESEYLFNFVPSAGVARIFPGPASAPDSWFVHYAIEIEPQHFTLAREENGNEYFTRFEIQGEVTGGDGSVVYEFATTPFLRLTESELQAVGARPFAWRGMFPLIPGDFAFRVIVKNEARTEYTVFETDLGAPATGASVSAPLLVHGLPGDPGETYGAWAPGGAQLVPNGRGLASLGSPLTIAASAPGTERVTFRAAPFHASETGEGSGAEPPAGIATVREEEVAVVDGLALWSPDTSAWDSGRYTIVVAPVGDGRTSGAGAERTATLDLNARSAVAIPWGLTDSFDAEAPGRLDAALAEQFLRLGDHEAARSRFATALEANPNSARSRLVLARFALDDKEPQTAIRLLEPARAQNPDNAAILRILGDAHREAGNPSRAAELYGRTLTLVAPDAALLNALGWSLAASGRPGEAIPHLERSLEIDAAQPEIRDLLASARASAAGAR